MTWNKHVFHILLKAWERYEVIMFAGTLWRSQKLDMNPSSTLWETFFLHSFLFILPFFQKWYLVAYFLLSLSFQPEGDLCMFFTQVLSFFLTYLSSLSSSSSSSPSPALSVQSCTHTQISSDALSADYSLFVTKKYISQDKISYDKLWYNVICSAISLWTHCINELGLSTQ